MCKFNIGDKVKLLPHFNGGAYMPEQLNEILIISNITENFTYRGSVTTAIYFYNVGLWAEPHEIQHLSKLEQML